MRAVLLKRKLTSFQIIMKIMPCLRFPFPKIGRTIRLESLIFVKNSILTLWESRKAASWSYLFLQTQC